MTAKVSYANERVIEHDDPIPDAIWYRVDGHSNCRWLYVSHPSDYYEGIPVGIQDVYEKHLSSDEARAMATALTQAADEWDVRKAELDAERQRRLDAVLRCEEAGGHTWPNLENIKWAKDWRCVQCGSAPKTSGVSVTLKPNARTVGDGPGVGKSGDGHSDG